MPMESAPEASMGSEVEYSGNILRDVTVAFIVLEIFFVGLRFLALWLANKPFGNDDWLIIPSLVFCQMLNAAVIFCLNTGITGYHMSDLGNASPEQLMEWNRFLMAIPMLWSTACSFSKLVILALFLRIFPPNRYRIGCYVLIAITISWNIAIIISAALMCTPTTFLWDSKIENGRCFDITAFYRFMSLPNAITDLLMLILPQPQVLKLNTSRNAKIGLVATFLTGSVGLVTSIYRIVAFFTHNFDEDGSWVSVTYLSWTVIEPGVYLLAASMVSYRPLLRYIPTCSLSRNYGSHSGGISFGPTDRAVGVKDSPYA